MRIDKVTPSISGETKKDTLQTLALLASEDIRPMLLKLLLAQRIKLNEEPSQETSFLSHGNDQMATLTGLLAQVSHKTVGTRL